MRRDLFFDDNNFEGRRYEALTKITYGGEALVLANVSQSLKFLEAQDERMGSFSNIEIWFCFYCTSQTNSKVTVVRSLVPQGLCSFGLFEITCSESDRKKEASKKLSAFNLFSNYRIWNSKSMVFFDGIVFSLLLIMSHLELVEHS